MNLACSVAAMAAILLFLDPCSADFRPGTAASQEVPIRTISIGSFRIGFEQTRFGPLEFVGGFELKSADRRLGGLSSFRFLDAGSRFAGVADTGYWFFGSVTRDRLGRPLGISDFSMEPMRDRAGDTSRDKSAVDAEGLAIRKGVATVSFERDHRIEQFRIRQGAMGKAFRELDFIVPRRRLGRNKGFETLAHSSPYGAEQGILVAITERSLDRDGNILGAIIDGPGRGLFTVKRHGNFDITDGAFLPNGDLLILERSLSFRTGLTMRLRRIEKATIAKGLIADGPVLLQAGLTYQIDNMEGIDVWQRDSDGAVMVSLLSDDNHSIVQRNLYLEFRLVDEAGTTFGTPSLETSRP